MADLLNIEWRNARNNRDLAAKLNRVIYDSDSSGIVSTVESSCRDRVLVRVWTAGSQHAMMRQERRLKERRLPTEEQQVRTNQSKYACQFQLVAQEVLTKVMNQTSFHKRQFFYELRNEHRGLKEANIVRLFEDLALTIGEHPCRLGMKAQSKSQVYVPAGCELNFQRVDNVFEYYDTPVDSEFETMEPGRVSNIPGMIGEVRIGSKGKAIECVVVTEHRNIESAFQLLKGQNALPGSEGIMIVMTGGFPDFASREFLNLLSNHPSLHATPFLWLSDFDAHGLFQFFMLKHGCRSAAWASPSLVCPRLEFAGLTHDILDKIAKAYPERELEYARVRQPDLSAEEYEVLLQQYKDRIEPMHQSILMRVLSPKERAGHTRRLKSIEDNSYLDINDDLLARAAYDALEQGQIPLSLLSVNSLDPHGVSYLLRDVAVSKLGKEYEDVPLINRIDNLRADLAPLHTQEDPVGLPSSVPQQIEMQDEFVDEILD